MREERVRLFGMSILRTLNKWKKAMIIIATATVLFGCGEREENEVVTEADNSSVSTETSTEDILQVNTESVAETEEEWQGSEDLEEENQNDNEYKLPDWEQYEDQMNEEDKKDFQEYLAVLDNKESFLSFEWDGEKNRTFNEYLESIESKSEPDIEGVTLVDLDDQNGKELILEIYEGGGNYLILTRENGKFYGTSIGERSFENLQKDGKYLSSGGAGDAYYYTMKIDSNGVEEIPIGELHGEEKTDGSYGDRLEVNGEVIEDAQKWIEENYSDPVDWIPTDTGE